jgi:S-DNA-T family DNA segregation ATPase FtsK/SpoIIIE
MANSSSQRLDQMRAGAAPAFAIRVPVRLVGLLVLAAVAGLLVSLASWSVDDPSLSYASGETARNWLGFPGSVVADLAFQLIGLSALVFAVPPALWSYQLIRRRVPSHMLLRLIAWLLATLLAAGSLSFIAAPASWPLPTGLGGLAGGLFMTLATLVNGGAPEGAAAILYGLVVLAPTIAALWLALGIGGMAAAPKGKATRSAKAAPVAKTAKSTDEDREPVGGGVFDVLLGGLVHMGYSAGTAWRRAREKARVKRETETEDWRSGASEPVLDGHRPAERREPQLVVTRGPMAGNRINARPEQHDDDLAEPDEFDDADEDLVRQIVEHSPYVEHAKPRAPAPAAMASAPVVAPRVTAPAARPTPGNRLTREAQGSLLAHDGFELPPLSLLAEPPRKGMSDDHRPERLEANARRLEGVLEDFGVKGDIINVRPGPVVTLYELEPAPGIKSSRVISLADDIARSMSAISARVAVVSGRNAIGIELPNQHRETVFLREMLASTDFEKMKGKLPICLGKTIGGEPVIADLAKMPHLLIAGTTGSGKSVGINTMILSLLYQMPPEQCRLIMIDPKMLELSVYDGIPHLLTPVVTDPSKAVIALKWAVREMEDRYRKMSKIGVRNIDGFNMRVGEAKKKGEVITRTVQTGFDKDTGEAIFESEKFDLEPLPYIVIIVDEMADLMMVAGKDIEGAIQRLAQMARAAGIHMITATQRPSVDVITGTIKANFPTRVSFQVTSKIDSRTILGEQGAEQLLGNGDMLYMAGGGRIRRLHGPFVADGEVESIVAHLKSQGAPDYLDSITAEEEELDAEMPADDEFGGSGDELYDKAVNIVLQDKKASTSYIQRRLAIGYNKAATLIERMEREGVISPANHSGKREILAGGEQY